MNFYKCKCKNIIFLIIFTLIITQIFAVGAEDLRDKNDSERFDPFLEEIYKRWKDGLPISERDEMFLNMTETEFDQYVKQREEEARSYRENIGKSEGEKELSDEERIAGIEHRAREVEMETGAYHEKQIHPEMKLTNRFIVKYKDELEDLEKKTIKLEEKGQEREKKIRNKLQKKTEKIAKVETKKVNAKKFDVLTTQEKELPNLFIQEVKEMDIEGEIEYIQPDYPMKLTSWEEEIDKIEFDDLVIPWESTRGAGTVTAILDTMIDVDHPDLSGKMGKGWNFVQDNDVIYTSEYSDTAEHGTHIAGVISKIAPETQILPIVVFQNGTAFTSDIIAGIEYAQNAGADIVNCSWASTMENQALKEAMAASNMLFICAAGNDGKNLEEHPVYPAAYDLENILTVGSVNSYKGCSSFSNYGPKYVDLATYGEEICAAQPGGAYSAKSGTSIAAAYTSGAAALIMGCYETSTAAEVKQRMMDTSQRVSTLTDKVKDSNLLCLKNILEENPDPAARELLFVENTGEGINTDLNPTGTGWTLQAESKRPMVSMKYEYGLFLKADGTVYEWENGISEIPEKVDGLDHIIQVSAGNSHGLALKADGTVWAWGTNSYGQLGNGTTSTSLTPIKVQSGGSDLTNVVAIAAGSYHSMALKSDGSIWSWGGNSSGELGDGTVTKKTTPVQISASAGSEFTKISAGSYHSIALKNDGSVWTWGSNTYGQLGNGEMGNKKNKSVPVQVKSADGEGYLSGITDISAGNNHSIALQSNGEACAWGYNVYGQLGCGNTTSSNVLVAMADESNVPITNVMQIFAGYNGTLIINANGSLWGCGDNTSKKISNVSESKLLNVQRVCDEDGSFLIDIRNAYIGGTRSTAVKNNGELWTTKIMSNQISSPKRVFIVNAEKVSAGDKHSLALKSDGSVWAWGSNEKGQLGNNSLSDSSIPVQVLNSSGDGYLSDIVDIYAGTQFSLALKSDGTVWAWGANNNGQLGNNTRQDSSLPVQVKDSNGQDYLSGVTAITSCWNSVTVVKNNGSVWLWGATMFGESLVPIAVPYVEFMSNVIKAQTNGDTILVLKDDGTVWFWQNSPYAASSEPVAIMNQNRTELLDSATDIALPGSYYGTDSAYFYILANGGNAYFLQSQYIGEQLGDESGYFENVSSISIYSTDLLLVLSSGELVYYNRQSAYILPEIEYIQLQGEEFIKVTQATVGYDHKLALVEDGTVWAWEKNDRGQLGIGPDERGNFWKRWFTPGGGPVQVDSGTDYTLVRYSDGTVWAAGKNNFGQLGNGTTETSRKPIQVRNLEHIIDLQCGDNHNIALKSDGSVWTWGYNGKGQLGNGTIIDSHIPVQVQEESGVYLKDVVAIAAGVGHSVALKADGTIWVWGDNDYDQLGTSSILGSSTTAVKLEVEDEFEQKISAIAAGSYHNLALENGGHVLAWGNNGSGELGNGSNVFKISAVRNEENTGSLDGVTQIYAMDRYSMVVKSNGEVWGWGPMSMLSYMMESSNLPVRILDGQESLAGVSKIDGRSTHIFVLKENGEVLWLGEGMMDWPFWTRTETFSEVENLYEIIDIAVSENHAVALKGNGEVYFWGIIHMDNLELTKRVI